MVDLLTLVLAAGKGTRMKSNLTKVLHPVAGKPMINHIIDVVTEMRSEVVCIVGHQAEAVMSELKDKDVNFCLQDKQLGTGHAVRQAAKYIKKHQGPVLVVCGDTPLLTKKTLERLIDKHKLNRAGVSVLTAYRENPSGYGRIVRDNRDDITSIVEEKDADSETKEIKEVNSGVYCFDSELLLDGLLSLTRENAQGEYYLTDVVSYASKDGARVIPVMIDNTEEVMGINNRKHLARAEKVLRQRINDYHLENGVTIIDPDTTYIDSQVVIDQDVTIYPFTYIEGQTRIGSDTIVGPHNRLVNCEIGSHVELKSNCNIWESIVGNNCLVGPFAYIRPGCRIEDGVKIGDYVELKKAVIKEKSKVPHLSYVGDAEIGRGTNIGAGTIFANYDGENKHKTIVGDSVFIGSNTTLVAPVEVKDGGKTGAGSVVTRNVPENTTVVGVPARVFKKDKNEGDG